jgi:hypothetical protein
MLTQSRVANGAVHNHRNSDFFVCSLTTYNLNKERIFFDSFALHILPKLHNFVLPPELTNTRPTIISEDAQQREAT